MILVDRYFAHCDFCDWSHEYLNSTVRDEAAEAHEHEHDPNDRSDDA